MLPMPVCLQARKVGLCLYQLCSCSDSLQVCCMQFTVTAQVYSMLSRWCMSGWPPSSHGVLGIFSLGRAQSVPLGPAPSG